MFTAAVMGRKTAPQRYPITFLDLCMLPGLAKQLNRLRNLRGGAFPRLSTWALSAVTYSPVRERQEFPEAQREAAVKTEAERGAKNEPAEECIPPAP